MLKELILENFLFIQKSHLLFCEGLNVITGETGAGKSVLLEAVKLILGKNARSNLVLSGKENARVQAVFDITGLTDLKNFLNDSGLLNEDNPDELLINRLFKSTGTGKVFVNAVITTSTQLKQLGVFLMEIHGQNEHQTLLSSEVQRKLLDRMGDEEHQSDITCLKSTFLKKQKIEKELEELEQKSKDSTERVNELQEILKDLSSLNLADTNEEESLKNELNLLAHSEQIMNALASSKDMLDGVNELPGAITMLKKVLNNLRGISDYDNHISALAQRSTDIYYELEALEKDISYYADKININSDRLYQVQARLAEISRCRRKYNLDFEGLFKKYQDTNEELSLLFKPDSTLDKIKKSLEQVKAEYLSLAAKISTERKKLAKILSNKVSVSMQNLGFAKSMFEVMLKKIEPDANGEESVDFYVSLNPGSPANPLKKVASGGELSRVALAIKKELAICDSLPTLLFDEIDAGIGGNTAEAVAQSLHELSSQKQIILVTHLHQIAKEGQRHFVVEKTVVDDQTNVNILKVSDKDRVKEIARMLGQPDSEGLSFAETILLNKSNNSRSAG